MKKMLFLFALALVMPVSAQLVVSSGNVKRSYTNAEVFLNIHNWGPKNGCSGELKPTGRMTCGLKGASSEVTWWCVGTNKTGDLYLFTRKFPRGEPTAKTTSTNITYSGKEMVVWKDDIQQLILRPKK